jgi:xylan 1,4-beta-xylosidase
MKSNLRKSVAFVAAAISISLLRNSAQGQTQPTAAIAPYAVTISVEAGNSIGNLNPIWRWEGYDEPNYTYMPNGKKLIGEFAEAGAAQGPAHFRAHYLLCTGDTVPRLKWGSTNIYTEDAAGKPLYDFSTVDKVFDTYLQVGAKPYAQIGMMPKALAAHPDPYEPTWHVGGGNLYTGWTSPPNDYDKWRELIFQWAKHCVDRYGEKEVETWNWEVWNEPNIGYWKGTPEEYQKTYDYATDGLRKAIPNAKVGGAETAGAGGRFQRMFIEHCINGTNFASGKKGSPLDSISFHAKGLPNLVHNHVQMGIANQLRDIDAGFGLVASRPQTANLPIVIGESDPDGCAGCPATGNFYPQYGYRNTSLFAVYTIDQLTRTLDLAAQHKVNIFGSVTWAFEFEDQPIFGGFRALATDGIDLPVLNVYRMLGKMAARRLAVVSSGDLGLEKIMRSGVRGDLPDVHALASRDDNRLTLIAWNYHDDDVPGPDADITLNLTNLPAALTTATLTEWRIDATHSNSFSAWKSINSPAKLDPQQRQQLQEASKLAMLQTPTPIALSHGSANPKITLPRQGMSLIEIKW